MQKRTGRRKAEAEEKGKGKGYQSRHSYINVWKDINMVINSLIPKTSRRNLLFIAAIVWTFAGIMLLDKGRTMINMDPEFRLLRWMISLVGGALFYWILFTRISKKHVDRIINLPNDRPSIFSFFDIKGYIMMIGMISLGIFLRTSEVVEPFYLSVLYVTMGIPLFISSLRFYYSAINYKNMERGSNGLSG